MLNPVHLRTLAMVVRTGSFADAARRLGYTGSAVSQQVSTLERQLRTQLFERDAHSIRPTPAAEFIAARSATVMGALQALEDDIGLLTTGVLGRLRLGSFPTASELLLPPALSSFTAAHPRVEVHLDEAEPHELVPLLESREIDAALVYRYNLVPPRWPRRVTTQSLIREDLLLVRPGDAGADGPGPVALAELADHTWISTREGTAGSAVLLHLCRTAGFEPSVSYRSNNYGVIQGLVRAGLGIALVPALGLRGAAGISVARLAEPAPYREVLVATSPTSPPLLLDAFTEALRRAAREVAGHGPGLTRAA